MLTVDVTELLDLVHGAEDASQAVPQEMEAAFRRSGTVVVREAKGLAPVFTGQLRGGIGYELRGGGTLVTLKIKSMADHSIFVEKGTRPHFPPVGAVAGWAKAHGIEPFLVARAISKKGTKAKPFLEPAVERTMPAINKEMQNLIRIILARLAG